MNRSCPQLLNLKLVEELQVWRNIYLIIAVLNMYYLAKFNLILTGTIRPNSPTWWSQLLHFDEAIVGVVGKIFSHFNQSY